MAGGRLLHVPAEAIAELVGTDRLCASGAEGARTPGLRHAMAALFQLSYSPKGELSRVVYRRSLAVSSFLKP